MSDNKNFDMADAIMEQEREAGIKRARMMLAHKSVSGICEECAVSISPLRLKVMPSARCCARCQTEIELRRVKR